MSVKKKSSYETIDKIFEETHKIASWEGILKWRQELEKHGWTDEEFDKELTKRTYGKEIA